MWPKPSTPPPPPPDTAPNPVRPYVQKHYRKVGWIRWQWWLSDGAFRILDGPHYAWSERAAVRRAGRAYEKRTATS